MFFRFNGFFDEDSTQETLYHNSVCPLIPYLLQGHNASVFAYGPTGAGMPEIEDITKKKTNKEHREAFLWAAISINCQKYRQTHRENNLLPNPIAQPLLKPLSPTHAQNSRPLLFLLLKIILMK